MNELFHEPTEHDHLQDVIHMFTLHIHPTTTQRTCQHCDKVNTWTFREISNSHIISFVIWKNIVIRPNPSDGTSTIGKIVHWVNKMPTSQLLVCYCVILKMEGGFTFLPPWIVGQQLALVGYTMLWTLITVTCKMLELNKPNKLRAQLWSKENPISSKIVTSFWIKLILSWMAIQLELKT